jgi:hypothetical protein
VDGSVVGFVVVFVSRESCVRKGVEVPEMGSCGWLMSGISRLEEGSFGGVAEGSGVSGYIIEGSIVSPPYRG